DPAMMSKTTMSPATRRLTRVTLEDERASRLMFDTLLGENVAQRKEFITKHGARYLPLADI
ncbi:MAG: hypothetical protein WCR95_06125, partial [Eubacteriales bacterium]